MSSTVCSGFVMLDSVKSFQVSFGNGDTDVRSYLNVRIEIIENGSKF